MESKKDISRRKGAINALRVFAIIVAALVMIYNMPHPTIDPLTWNLVWESNSALGAENDPGIADSTSWLATFLLNFTGDEATTALDDNASGGDYGSWGNVTGYVSADDTEFTIASEAGSYFVIRHRINATHCANAGALDPGRVRVYLTVTGDETYTNVLCTNIVSANVTGYMLYVNSFYNDTVDGFSLSDDGSAAWNCSLYCLY